MGYRLYEKIAPLYTMSIKDAKEYNLIDENGEVDTLEGVQEAKDGDVLCKGVDNELWPQPKSRVESKYNFDKDVMSGGYEWRKWNPKPGQKVEAEVLEKETIINNMTGKKGDYKVRSVDETSDVWIVDSDIFQKSHREVEK